MTIDTDDLLNSIIKTFGRMKYITPDEIPDIDLYMDQVTTFLDEHLKSSTRIQTDEKLMTKTMINNYAKNDVIPPPVLKKYTKEHVLVLIIVYYFKSILQINDIKDLIKPVTDKFFGTGCDFAIEDIYNEIFSDKKEQLEKILEDVKSDYADSLTKFKDAPEDDREYLELFSFVCALGCDVFVKKLLIEKIVDSLRAHQTENRQKENKYDMMPEKAKK